jgi:predicted lysophospholipase L1 biosynthesis ABC-type transport system permease subunit
MARFIFGTDTPIGRRFATDVNSPPLEIVGVVKDAKLGTPRDRRGAWYVPYRQAIGLMRTMVLVVRANGTPRSLAQPLRQELRAADPDLPVLRIDTIGEQLDDTLAQERLVATLASLFGAVAVVLACVGLYGLISYSTQRRTSEIGIRLALGATHGRVMRLVLGEGLRLVLIGAMLGVPAALAGARIVSIRLYGVSATDPASMVGATLLIVAVALLASYVPARRAAMVDPMLALRSE